MRGRLFGRRQLCVIGLVLCLLAALFALEAKLAWFSPAGTPCAQISAAKLQPADAPRLIAQVLVAPHAWPHFPAEAHLLLAVVLFVTIATQFFELDREGVKPLISNAFSPHLFRRPPPKL
ncbi:MAG TPA: hypothetical protein VKB47_10480 [Terracidiphilus sp.]|nr:hypothetical protein [Terracidiphilus sp.]